MVHAHVPFHNQFIAAGHTLNDSREVPFFAHEGAFRFVNQSNVGLTQKDNYSLHQFGFPALSVAGKANFLSSSSLDTFFPFAIIRAVR